jgi:hypothetical protein
MTQRRDRRRSGSSRLPRPNRSERTTVLIVCEGRETEPNYFDRLKREEHAKKNFTIKVKKGKGGSRQQVAQFAVERKENAGDKFDEVWCVMDVERPEGLPDIRAALTLLESNHIKAALSNPAFEVWLLAHFEKTGTGFLDGDAVASRLNKHWKEHFSTDYDKADGQIYYRLIDRLDQAMANAKWVREQHHSGGSVIDSNSSTDLDVLVGKLLGV